MKNPKRRYTAREIAYAKRLFAAATAGGFLKPPRAIAALALSSGHRRTVMQSQVTYRDYLRDARWALTRHR